MSGKYSLVIDKNSSYEVSFALKNDDDTPVNLNGYSVEFIARAGKTILHPILFTADSVEIEDNIITVKVEAISTKDVDYTTGYYNLIIKTGTHKYRIIEGVISLTSSVDNS